jgi:hypothetical protein
MSRKRAIQVKFLESCAFIFDFKSRQHWDSVEKRFCVFATMSDYATSNHIDSIVQQLSRGQEHLVSLADSSVRAKEYLQPPPVTLGFFFLQAS